MKSEDGFDRTQRSINSALDIAASWEKKNDLVWTTRNIKSAARLTLAISVGKYPDADSAVAYLTGQRITPLLQKLTGLQKRLLVEVEAGRVPADEFSGNYISLALSHLCCVLNDFVLARAFADVAFHEDILNTSTNFWYDYARGYRYLWEKRPYKKGTFPELRHTERYWLPYMDLMEAATHGQPQEPALTSIEASFVKRNQDKRVEDSYMLDGSALIPVKWDFRRDGLLRLIGHLYNTTGTAC